MYARLRAVPAGSLDDPSWFSPTFEDWTSRAYAWHSYLLAPSNSRRSQHRKLSGTKSRHTSKPDESPTTEAASRNQRQVCRVRFGVISRHP
jgi:hypothetical protein